MSDFQLRQMTIQNADPVGLVQFSIGDATKPEGQWLAGQIQCDMSNIKSVALLQIRVLTQLNELIDAEKQRLILLYEAAQRSPR
jgi:hypothetical protein